MRTTDSFFEHTTRIIWSLLATGTGVLCIVMVLSWHQTVFAWCSSVGAIVLGMNAMIQSLHDVSGRTVSPRTLRLSMVFAAATGAAPFATRLLMPWEEPETGFGSPMAVLINACLSLAFFAVVISAPLLILAGRVLVPRRTMNE